ncbi:MAG: M3 family metallopeptidase, partial [Oscillospiraceae bacterium]|nr:M3 family metallopeptidase [Oscillospiraceae bacterium]
STFIFANFNGTSGDIDVLTHEAGHALAFYLSRDIRIGELRPTGADTCEIHSMSMEFFTWPWMEGFFGDATDKYLYNHLASALFFLPYGVIVDAFQHLVYEKPEMTPKERKQAWLALERAYRPWIDFEDVPFYSEGGRWQAQSHIYEMPFYYIDYCLAQTVALTFWSEMQSDRKAAWARYMKLVGEAGSRTFSGLVSYAGLPLPFDPEALTRVTRAAADYLDQAKIG